ncbi:MAG TPA: hypothetical protein PKO03_04880 [Anaerolineaceae bacterium]|nr:hypothetical protein [Anaerolineaceae bacterium]HNS37435.1 hypothetical protein [Anaerolineaceae bacterium]
MNSLPWMVGGYIVMLGLLAIYIITLLVRARRLKTAICARKKQL